VPLVIHAHLINNFGELETAEIAKAQKQFVRILNVGSPAL
jgi:hypothetical protein